MSKPNDGMTLPPSAPQRLRPGVLLPHGRFAWWYALLGAALTAGGLIGFIWLKIRWLPHSSFMDSASILSQGLLFVLAALLTPLLASRRVYAQDFPAPRGMLLWRTAVVLLVWIVMQAMSMWFERSVSGAEEASKQVARWLGLGQGVWPDVAVVLAVTVMAPLGEELFFRGLLYRSLRDGVARWLPMLPSAALGMVLSSLLFAVMHVGDGQDTQWPALFVMGILMALSYEWTGSLLAPMMVHALNNMLALAQAMALPDIQVSTDWMYTLTAASPLIVLAVGWGLLRALPNAPAAMPAADPQSAAPMPPPGSNP
ncbi:MAG: type II CAAX endopeptidase family protein [Brachymonas sp.]|nr:type II CAAX endopeptidase family protein [Brachymonas sp.]